MLSVQVYEDRLNKLMSRLRASSIEAVVLSSPANVFYFTGFRGGVLIIHGDGAVTLFSNQPVNTPLAGRISIVEKLGRREVFSTAFEYIGNRRMTVGYDFMSVENYQAMIKFYPSFSFTAAKDLLYELRQSKSLDEIESLKQASLVACSALEVVREIVTTGTTPSDIRRALADMVYRSGAELAFNPRISMGEETFLQTQSQPNRGIKKGELLRITVGVMVNGYISHISRTLFYGEKPPEKLAKTYQTLIRLKEYIKSVSAVWTSAVSIYDRSRAFAMETGLEPSSLTMFGKGVGLEEEEPPFIQAGSTDILREATVVSLGPDLLLPGRYGLSVSDIYLVSTKGVEQLTNLDDSLEIG